jgi:hypothetical protein
MCVMANSSIHITLAYFMTIWYILGSFGIRFTFLACCAKKNLAALVQPINYSNSD